VTRSFREIVYSEGSPDAVRSERMSCRHGVQRVRDHRHDGSKTNWVVSEPELWITRAYDRCVPPPQASIGITMTPYGIVVATFDDHQEADAAVRKLITAGFDMKHFSVVGKGYHTDEKIVGFYSIGDRMKIWGKYGAFWGGLWGLFFGSVFITFPVIGPVVILGYLAAAVVSAVEGAVVVGGISALGAALFTAGMHKDSVIHYESVIKEDGFLIVAHGPAEEMARAKDNLATSYPKRLDLHERSDMEAVAEPAV